MSEVTFICQLCICWCQKWTV